MKTNNNIHSLISTTPHDGTLYLALELSANAAIFILDGNLFYIVRNEDECEPLNITTEYLQLRTNIYITAFSSTATTFANGYYNSIALECFKHPENIANIDTFVNLCMSHVEYMNGRDLDVFFNSLVSLFQLPREQSYKNLIGLYGELSLIKYFHDKHNIDISRYWHTEGANSKLDFVTPYMNIEVKTSQNDQLLFQVKHTQIFENPSLTYLAAISISENNSGSTLEELTNSLVTATDYCNSLSFAINIESEKRRISLNDTCHRRFCLKSILFYDAFRICPFGFVPENISDLSYRINLASLTSENVESIVKNLSNA